MAERKGIHVDFLFWVIGNPIPVVKFDCENPGEVYHLLVNQNSLKSYIQSLVSTLSLLFLFLSYISPRIHDL